MATPCAKPSTISICLDINFEGTHGAVPESRVYAVDADGEIIANLQVSAGKVLMTLPFTGLAGTTIAIGPASGTPADTRDGNLLFSTGWRFIPGTSNYCLQSVPENLWRWWLVRNMYRQLHPRPFVAMPYLTKASR